MIIWGNLWRVVAGLAISAVVAFAGLIALAASSDSANLVKRYRYAKGWIVFVFIVYALIIGRAFR